MNMQLTEKQGETLRNLLGSNEDPTSLVAKLHSVMKELEPEINEIINEAIQIAKERKRLAGDLSVSDSERDETASSVNEEATPWTFAETEDTSSPMNDENNGEYVKTSEITPSDDVGTQKDYELIQRVDELIDQLVGPLGDAAKNNPELVKELSILLQKLGYKISAILENASQHYLERPLESSTLQKPSVGQQTTDSNECDCPECDVAVVRPWVCSLPDCRRTAMAEAAAAAAAADQAPCSFGAVDCEGVRDASSRSARGRAPTVARGYATRLSSVRQFRGTPRRRSPTAATSESPEIGQRWQSDSPERVVETDVPATRVAVAGRCCAQGPCLKPKCKYKFCK